MPVNRTKVTRKKTSKRKTAVKAKAPASTVIVAAVAAAPATAVQAGTARGYGAHNTLVLAAAIVSLAVFGGSAVLPMLSGRSVPAPARLDDVAISREIARAVAEGKLPDDTRPVTVQAARPVETSPVKTEAKIEARPQLPAEAARAPQPEARPAPVETAPRTRAQRIRDRRAAHEARRLAAAKDPRSLTAMASASSNALIAEARKYLGGNPTGWSADWCGKFLDMVLRKTGHRGGGNLARGYIKYGVRLAGPEVGAIAVFARKGGGHVGIVTGIDSNGNPIIISGNHNDRVAIAAYPASRALAYVKPAE
jgi:uncharacterized protein (TIGR02594 family)